MAWQDFGTALALVLVIEGLLPLLYPARWRALVAGIAGLTDRALRLAGAVTLITGLVLLLVMRSA